MVNVHLTLTSEGTRIPVRVTPRASRTQIDGEYHGALRVKLKAPPVDGAANRELTRFLANILGCRQRDLEIVNGVRSREKTILVRNIGGDEVLDRLKRASI
jgi:uncharacterized protein